MIKKCCKIIPLSLPSKHILKQLSKMSQMHLLVRRTPVGDITRFLKILNKPFQNKQYNYILIHSLIFLLKNTYRNSKANL